MFHVGQHIVCVDDYVEPNPDEFWAREWRRAGLARGRVYTVRDVYRAPLDELDVLSVEEIVRPRFMGVEIGFRCTRFRPLSSDRLSIFRKHLAPLSTDKVEA